MFSLKSTTMKKMEETEKKEGERGGAQNKERRLSEQKRELKISSVCRTASNTHHWKIEDAGNGFKYP